MQILAKIASWSSAHPWRAVGVVFLLTAALGSGFAQAESGRVIDQFVPDDLEAVATQDEITRLFGSSEPGFILIITDEPGNPDLLRAMDLLNTQLETKAVVQTVATITDELGDVQAQSDGQLRAAWNQAAARPDLGSQFVRDDATLMRVAFDTGLEPEDITVILDEAYEILDIDGATVMPAGLAYIEQAQSEGGAQDVQYLVPLSVLVIAIVLSILFRRPADVVIPIATTFVALAWAYGIMTWAQMPLSPLVFSVMPLILGLGVDYMLHIVYAFRATGEGPHPARFAQVGHNIGRPVFFTALTTLIGFGSFLASKIPQVRAWGLLIGAGAASAFVLGFLLLPALYRLSRPPKYQMASSHVFLSWLGRVIANKRIYVLLGLAVATIGLGIAATQVNVERQLETEIDATDPASVALDEVETRFGGQSIAQFLVPREVGPAALEQLEENIAKINGTGFVDGPATRTAAARQPANGYPADSPALDGVATDEAWLVSVGYATDAEREVIPLLKDEANGSEAKLTGRGLIQLEAEGAVLDSLLLSTGVAFGLVLLLLLFVFRHPAPALIAFTPLALVIVWQLGIQFLIDIPFNSVTGITSAMVLGIGVDYSLHLMSDIERGLKSGKSRWSAAVDSVIHVGQPVLAGTITTVAAFTVLSFSQLSQLQQFGSVAAIVVACAFIISIGFVPAFIARQRSRSNRIGPVRTQVMPYRRK